jgi:hypothetical protein
MTWEDGGCIMFLDFEGGNSMIACSFDNEMTLELLLEEKEYLIVYKDMLENKSRYLMDKVLLAITCIEHFFTGKI